VKSVKSVIRHLYPHVYAHAPFRHLRINQIQKVYGWRYKTTDFTDLTDRTMPKGSAQAQIVAEPVGDFRRPHFPGDVDHGRLDRLRFSPISRAYCTDTARNTAVSSWHSVQSIACNIAQRIMNPLVPGEQTIPEMSR
jgi:hypothetical protein